MCDATTPDPAANCVKTGTLFGTGVLGNDPGAVSVFDNAAYIADNNVVRKCTNLADVSSCSSASGLNLSPVLSGASNIFIQPRI